MKKRKRTNKINLTFQ